MKSEGEKTPNQDAMERLAESIVKAIDYHVAEYDLTYDQVIGGLEILKLNLYRELIEGMEEEDDETDDKEEG